MGDINVLPFLKWAGGKRWLVANHSEWFHGADGRHVEPFLGSGAVFFHLKPNKSLLSDSNEELIEAYTVIRDDPDAVRRQLKIHQRQHSTDYYYKIRTRKARTPVTRAGRFIYLNRTCFNGLYRVNLSGEFNVPKGTKSAVVLPSDDFYATSRILQTAQLSANDFEETVSNAGAGDFLYVDPPYTVKHNHNNFIKYNERIFSWSDQVRLSKSVLNAAKRGVHVLVSNADHPSVRDLYRNKIWVQLSVDRFSRLASSPEFRRSTTELVVSNYLARKGKLTDPRT